MDAKEQRRDDLARAIGHVAMESSRVERLVATTQVVLLGGDSRLGAIVARGQPWAATLQACLALIESITHGAAKQGDVVPEELSGLPAVLKRADKLMAARSNVVHGAWLPPEPDGQVHASWVFKRWGRVEQRPWTLESLAELQRDLRAVGNEIFALTMGLLAEDPA